MSWSHWVFDGFGVAIPIALITIWLNRRQSESSSTTKLKQRGGKNSTNVQIVGDLSIGREDDTHD